MQVNSQINQLKMGTILSYVSIIIQNIVAMIYTPVMLRMLGQDEYGLYQLGNSMIAYLSLLSFGFGSSYVKFYYQYKVKNEEIEIKRLNSIFLLVFSILGILSLLAGGGMVVSANFIFGNSLTVTQIEKVRILMLVMVFTTALTFPNIIFDCYITAHEKYIFQRLLLILINLLNPILTLPLLFMGWNAMALGISNFILTVFRISLNIFYCRKRLNMRFLFHGMKLHVLKSVGIFSFYIFLNEVVNQINWNVDKMILGAVQGAGVVAVYSVGSQFNQYFMNMSVAVSNVFIPRVNRMVAERQNNYQISQLFIRIGRIQYIILSAVLSGYLLYGQFFIRKWAGKGYEEAYFVGAIIMVPCLIPLIQNIGIEIQRAENKHKFRSIAYFIIAILNLLISIPLAKKYGAIGAAAGTAFATIAGNIFLMNWYYEKRIGLDIKGFFKSMGRPTAALLVAIVEGGVVKMLIPVTSWAAFFIEGCVFLFVYFGGLCLFGFSSDERAQIKMIKKRWLTKNGKTNG